MQFNNLGIAKVQNINGYKIKRSFHNFKNSYKNISKSLGEIKEMKLYLSAKI